MINHNETSEAATAEVSKTPALDTDQRITNLTALLVTQLAEMRGQAVTTQFLMLTFLENTGCDGETLLAAVEQMGNATADSFEAAMRKACGLEPRKEPRQSMLEKMRADQVFAGFDWSKVGTN